MYAGQTEAGELAKRKWGSARKSARARGRGRAEPPPGEDHGTAERWRKAVGVERVDQAGRMFREAFRALELEPRLLEGAHRPRAGLGARNRLRTPLDALYLRGLLGDLGDPEGRVLARMRWRAGERLERAYAEAGIRERTSANLAAVGGGGGRRGVEEQTDREAELEMVYRRMVRASAPHGGLLHRVCCGHEHPGEAPAEIQPLVAGLDLLAAHLRLRDDDDGEMAGGPPGEAR